MACMSWQASKNVWNINVSDLAHLGANICLELLSGEPDYFGRNKISSGSDLSHYSSASLY